eukprot:2836712-Rhodomonas_salina.1
MWCPVLTAHMVPRHYQAPSAHSIQNTPRTSPLPGALKHTQKKRLVLLHYQAHFSTDKTHGTPGALRTPRLEAVPLGGETAAT